MKELRCIMLIDDDENDNFVHERVIRKSGSTIAVIPITSGEEALEYLTTNRANNDLMPDLVFLDINMPRMNGWEFLQQYDLIKTELGKEIFFIMLSTSENPDDIKKSKTWNLVVDYISKPLTKEIMEDIKHKYFS
jgi:CheY-like chemotaxis protein